MKVWKENQLELAVCNPTASFQDSLALQKELFHSQIDQLEDIVATQCKLTGVNPLSQEMAAGALSIKIGKRPRDLLNPKAIKYMQSIFSVKDDITKKESREISARFGVTVTQVREFFNSQRSRVRKVVRLSREKTIRSNACKEVRDGLPSSSDPVMPIEPVPLNCVAPSPTISEGGPSCSTQDEVLPGVDDSDKHFIENIFSMMRKEETFSGQVKLMEWILQIQNPSVLHWFLTKGGVMILATLLSQAATEEQTSVLNVILKVLCHLPIHKALPAHMSAILQSVNRLRFYRTSDISNRARTLLTRWSKIFARSQAMKKPNALKSASDVQDEMLLKQSIGEIMGNESWDSNADVSDKALTPYNSSENFRRLESPQPLKLLTASTDDSNKKLMRGVPSSQIRERRKVLLVEQPGQRTAGRSVPVARSVSASQGRPLSADDIQKAKMRAQFMQSKYGKNSTASDESPQVKSEGPSKNSSAQASSLSKGHVRPKIEEHKNPEKLPLKVSNQQEAPLENNMSLDPEEPAWKKCKRVQIHWKTPPEARISGAWRVSTGENSKEVEVQRNRIRREKEIIYRTFQEIPSDPKEPWDREMDYDDTLTPEIPTEQLPDVDGVETVVSPRETETETETEPISVASSSTTTTSSSQNGNATTMPEPDLELLAVLLKNPELVLALTTGQGQAGGLSSEDTVKLLDMIKANGVSSLSNLTGLERKAEEKVQVSLPSPTPSSDPVTSGWRPDFAKNPFSRQNGVAIREADAMPGVVATASLRENLPGSSLVQPRMSATTMFVHNRQPIAPHPPAHQAVLQASLPQKVTALAENSRPLPIPLLHQNARISSVTMQRPSSGVALNMDNISVSGLALPNFSSAASSVVVNPPERPPHSFPSPPLLPTPTPTQSPLLPDPRLPTYSWRVREVSSSNPLSQPNQNNHNVFVGGPVHASMQRGPWERNELVREPGFESWSPENSPIRSPHYMPGRNYPGARMDLDHNYRPERSRPQNPLGYHDHSRDGNRRWRDHDRDRDRDRRR